MAKATDRSRLVRRGLTALAAVGVGWFAFGQGEYGAVDLWRQRQRAAALRAEVDSLQQVVDSLEAFKDSVARSPAMQERIAREEFGMVRSDKELLYRFVEPSTPNDSSDRDPP